MPTYEYKALDKKGKEVKGLIETNNEEVIVEKLRGMGYFPVEVRHRKKQSKEWSVADLPGIRQLRKLFTAAGVEEVPEDRRTFTLPVQEPFTAKNSELAAPPAVSHRILEAESTWKKSISTLLGKTGVPAKCLGVEMNPDCIRLAELNIDKRGITKGHIFSAPSQISPNAPLKERADAAASAVKCILQQNDWSLKEAVCCFSRKSAWIEKYRLPPVSSQRLERIIRYEAGKRIPSSSPFLLVYDLLKPRTLNEIEVLLIAVPEESYKEYHQMVQSIGIHPAGICVASLDVLEEGDFHVLNLKRRTKTIRFILLPREDLRVEDFE